LHAWMDWQATCVQWYKPFHHIVGSNHMMKLY